MARPLKDGIDYFPLDINFLKDIKIRKILIACGPQSIAVLISLLCTIYRDDGYYMRWDEDVRFLISDEVGVKESLVQEVVTKTIDVDFFNADLFKKYKILTSAGTQKRYLEATSRRKNTEIKNIYNLINVNNNSVNVNNNSVNVYKSTQRKGKESKEKERREIYSINSLLPKFTMLLSSKPNTLILSQMQEKWDLKKIYDEVSKSAWLQENLDLSRASDSFLAKIVSGYYRNFKKNKNKNSYNPTTDKYSNAELEEIGKAKTDKLLEEMDNER